jgi:alpha-galactosidase
LAFRAGAYGMRATRRSGPGPLADGGRAVILFNRGAAPAVIKADWTELGYPRGLKAEVRDLWAHKSLGRMAGSVSATVEPHGAVMVRLLP